MKRMFLSVFFVLLMAASTFPQGWGPTVNLGNISSGEFDVYTNKYGHHLLSNYNGNIIYRLYSSTGTLVRTTTLQASDGDDPIILGNDNDVYAIYKYSTQVIVKKSINGGASWSANIGPAAAPSFIYSIGAEIDANLLFLSWRTETSIFFSRMYLSSLNWTTSHQVIDLYFDYYNENLDMVCVSGYLYLATPFLSSVYIHKYDILADVWDEAYDTIENINDRVKKINISSIDNKLFIFTKTESIIGTKTLTAAHINGDVFSKSLSGGSWNVELLLGSMAEVSITRNGQMNLLYNNRLNDENIYASAYIPSIGWSSSNLVFSGASYWHGIWHLSSYGNNLYAFYNEPSSSGTPLYFRPYNAIPEPPTNLHITIGTTSLLPELTWTASEKSFVSQYEIWGKVGAAGTWSLIGLTTYTYFTDMDMYSDDNNSYNYKIRAKSTANLYSVFSSEVSTIPSAPVNVALSSASGTYGNIKISWTKNPEANVTSYEVYREDVSEGSGWQLIGTTALNYLIDPQYLYVPNWGITTCNYKVRAKNNLLKYSPYSGIASVNAEPNYKQNGENPTDDEMAAPVEYNISQNYPNPFNPSTVIVYDIPEAARVTLKVYDMLGREVADLVDEYKEAGRYSVKFDASRLSTGIYIYKLTANEFQSIKKMNFVK